MPILKTRLYKPPLKEHFIVRERLIAQLNHELERPLKLIVAGAGYGKSILMSQWLDTCQGKYCWISLEEDCNDLNIFLYYLIAGIQQIFPKSMVHLAQISSSGQMPPDEAIAHTLNNELHDLAESLIIVFDDFHVIRNKTILNLFNGIIKHPPENVQIALLTRLDPPINKARLQAYQQVSEIRMSDLRLSIEEIKELAKRSVQIDIASETAEAIERITEGWAISVYLKIRELAESSKAGTNNYLFHDHSSNLAPFLFNLLETRLPPDAVKVVLVFSLFDRSNSGLIELLFKETEETGLKGEGIKHAFQKIVQLDSPFLIYLDEDRMWFRIHHLIREILSKRLFQTCPSDQIEKYYKAAGAYFADQDYYEEGIQYSVLGNNIDLAIKIITTNWEKLIDNGENLRLHRWLNMIPAGVLDTNTSLLVSRAFLCDMFADFDAMKTYLGKASSNIDAEGANPRILGAFAAVHSCFSAYTNDFPTAENYANLALDTLTPDQSFMIDYAFNFKIFSTSMIKSPALAREILDKYRSNRVDKSDRHLMRINVIKLLFDWNQATIMDLKQSGNMVVDISMQEKIWWLYKMGNYYLGQYYYMKNQVREVYSYLDAGIECFFNAGAVWALQLYYSGALAALADNDLAKAHDYLRSAKEFVELNKLEAFEGYLRAFEVEFALRTYDVEKAWKLNASANYSIHPPIYYYYIPQFTQVKLYIEKGDAGLMKEASLLIRQYKGMFENPLYARIQLYLLEAVWLSRSGLHEKAVSALSEVIAITPEDDYIRVFIDLGQPVKELFHALPEEEKQHPLVRNVLNAFRYETNIQPPASSKEELTVKESKIMHLVEEGMLNKEIADQLHLSEPTIKTYLYRIYQKLGVKNRYAAMKRLKQA